MSDCPFCTASMQGNETIVASNEWCYVLAYREQDTPGMMVIPYRHVESPIVLNVEEWSALQPLIIAAKEELLASGPDGFNIGWNVGSVGGQHVFHAHLHVFPRFADEPYAGRGIRHLFKSAENKRPS